MKTIRNLSAFQQGNTVSCAVAAHATLRATAEELRVLRQTPGPGQSIPAAFLKHVDPQTVTGLAAVLQAIRRHGLDVTSFSNWGVLGAPRFLARTSLAQAIKRFADEGAWGVSPHLIPHCSLHALSGTVSQALKIHGPNFGVGGGPHGASKAMLAAAALLENDQCATRLPGIWMVVTGWSKEPALHDPPPASGEGMGGGALPAPLCHAVALALIADVACGAPTWQGLRLHVSGSDITHRSAPSFSLEALSAALEVESLAHTWQLGCGGWCSVTQGATTKAIGA